MNKSLEISVREAQAILAEGRAVLVDVREPDEFAIAKIAGSQLIPMQTIPSEFQRLEALGDEGEILVLCHHGVRSLQVTNWLREKGIENCYSVAGGIDLWSAEIDTNIPRY